MGHGLYEQSEERGERIVGHCGGRRRAAVDLLGWQVRDAFLGQAVIVDDPAYSPQRADGLVLASVGGKKKSCLRVARTGVLSAIAGSTKAVHDTAAVRVLAHFDALDVVSLALAPARRASPLARSLAKAPGQLRAGDVRTL